MLMNPATGESLGDIPKHSDQDLEQRMDLARETFRLWSQRSFDERAQVLRRIAQELREGRESHAMNITIEMGKPQSEALGEIDKTAWCIEHYADHAQQYLSDVEMQSDASRSWVRYLPLGTVLGILPWNGPYWLAARVMAPALMAGNTVLIKHDEHVPRCGAAIEELFRDVEGARGLLQSVYADHEQIASMIHDDRVQAVSFTGSTAGGRAVAREAGAAIKPAVLELGGSDPAIVFADADIDKAVDTVASSRYICAGQSCIAAKRILVERSIHDEFVEKFLARAGALHVGDPMQMGTEVGPMAREELRANLHDQVRRSIEAGAKCLIGGEIPEGPGFFYPVTVLDEVPESAAAYREETFGPVACISCFDDTDDAVRMANDTPYGLAAAVWSQREDVVALSRRLECGQVAINGIVKTDPRLPSGGIKQSGLGRELGPFGIREFVNAQQVWQGPAE